jgi:hypothetical protein
LGNNERERYKNHGWGLLQVIDDMAETIKNSFSVDDKNMLQANKQKAKPDDIVIFIKSFDLLSYFRDSAKKMLQTRVANALPEKDEQKFLCGWCARVATYV